MPRVCEFYGAVIYIYYNDHEPPHFHVRYGGNQVKVSIDPVRVVDGQLPRQILSRVFEWAEGRQPELSENWRLARAKRTLFRIEPLE